jgi:hypothetical protein
MTEHYCSLKFDGSPVSKYAPQSVPPNVWTPVRFPAGAAEPEDDENMHPYTVDGVDYPYSSPEASLIRPPVTGPVGHWYVKVNWETGQSFSRALKTQLCRDPFGEPDWTGTDTRAPLPDGAEHDIALAWAFRLNAAQPVAVRVKHNEPSARRIVLAEFKLWYVD